VGVLLLEADRNLLYVVIGLGIEEPKADLLELFLSLELLLEVEVLIGLFDYRMPPDLVL
jgi:hypothetical protein